MGTMIEEVQVTAYKCLVCGHIHDRKARAETCCVCECGATGVPLDRDGRCAKCVRNLRIKSLRDVLKRREDCRTRWLDEHESRMRSLQSDIDQTRAELDALLNERRASKIA
jgi:hypothetical protein